MYVRLHKKTDCDLEKTRHFHHKLTDRHIWFLFLCLFLLIASLLNFNKYLYLLSVCLRGLMDLVQAKMPDNIDGTPSYANPSLLATCNLHLNLPHGPNMFALLTFRRWWTICIRPTLGMDPNPTRIGFESSPRWTLCPLGGVEFISWANFPD